MNIIYSTSDTSKVMWEFTAWELIKSLQNRSYLAAELDSITQDSNSINIHIYLGNKLKYGKITWEGLDDQWMNHPLLRKIDFEGKPIQDGEYKIILNTILSQLEEFGYPLAKIEVKNKQIRSDSLFADISLKPGNLITFGGVEQDTADVIGTDFLSRYLNIQNDQLFQMSKIESIEKQINQLAYIRLNGAPQIRIINNQAKVKLKIKENPASRFDFIIGILPNVETESPFVISGELTADLKNKFKRGEEVFIHIQQLKPETQRIDFRASYPYLLNLPFGIHGSFSLYKNGLESRDLNGELGVQYRSGESLDSKFFINYQASRLIEIDSSGILNRRQLPSSLDVRSNNIGVRLSNDRRDYRFNPRKGMLAEISLLAGIRTIIPNNNITGLSNENVDFSTAYDSLDLSIFQATLNSDLEYYIPIKGLSTIKLANKTGLKWNQSQVYLNEYYRIGGSNILRGFDEESIRAQYYSIFTAEYRYLLSLNSYFSAFIDYGLIYNDFRSNNKFDQPFGFGVGLSFQTTAGIFGIDVALGREQGNNLDFRNAKTHFGFISLF